MTEIRLPAVIAGELSDPRRRLLAELITDYMARRIAAKLGVPVSVAESALHPHVDRLLAVIAANGGPSAADN